MFLQMYICCHWNCCGKSGTRMKCMDTSHAKGDPASLLHYPRPILCHSDHLYLSENILSQVTIHLMLHQVDTERDRTEKITIEHSLTADLQSVKWSHGGFRSNFGCFSLFFVKMTLSYFANISQNITVTLDFSSMFCFFTFYVIYLVIFLGSILGLLYQ